jgi:hypothetical protein
MNGTVAKIHWPRESWVRMAERFPKAWSTPAQGTSAPIAPKRLIRGDLGAATSRMTLPRRYRTCPWIAPGNSN